MITRLLNSKDPAIRRLAGDPGADPFESELVRDLLQFPKIHPYRKWFGTHWRLVSLADLRLPYQESLAVAVERELEWLASNDRRRKIQTSGGLARICASMEGNALYACSSLGFSSDPRVRTLRDRLLETQWPDGGWNCDVNATGRRSSFHETVIPAIGLFTYAKDTGDEDARAASVRAAELILEHRLFRSLRTGEVIHPSWVRLHYPSYWHYDILQGLELLRLLDLLEDPRAVEALDRVEVNSRADGRFSGPSWASASQPDSANWGAGPENEMLNLRAELVLQAARRS